MDTDEHGGPPAAGTAEGPLWRGGYRVRRQGRRHWSAALRYGVATLDRSRWLAGGMEFRSPAGTNYSRNLTPDGETGLAKWTEKQFVVAMRKGLSPTRGELMPPMPLYDRITTKDLHAMWAYLRTVKPIHNQVPARKPAEQPKE